tara:strand:- start:572 stop:901 length:330 start_codon:yes stop_codon:yes gene_type:complete
MELYKNIKENNMLIQTKEVMKNPVAMAITIVFTTVFTHWSLIQCYAHYCAPSGWLGPFKTFLTLGSPTCHFVNVLQLELAKHYMSIWIGFAAAIIVNVIVPWNNKSKFT